MVLLLERLSAPPVPAHLVPHKVEGAAQCGVCELLVPAERSAEEPVVKDERVARYLCGLSPDLGAVGRGEQARMLGDGLAVGHHEGMQGGWCEWQVSVEVGEYM